MLQTQQLNNAVVHHQINVMQSQSAMGQSGPTVSHHGILQQRTTQQIQEKQRHLKSMLASGDSYHSTSHQGGTLITMIDDHSQHQQNPQFMTMPTIQH